MNTRRTPVQIVLLLALVTVVGVALAPFSDDLVTSDSSDEDFRAFMEPRLIALVDSALAVDNMVNGKSRNVLALRLESEHIESLVSDIDAYLADHDVPAGAETIVADYRDGTGMMLTAIDAAYAAIRSFDFSKMADMIPVFDEGTRLLQQALATLQDTGTTIFIVH